ncbi:MAG: diaminopimelate decarboxylase [Eubacteriales bacterium]|nr:diaminopimelate decarboxylase [Eubacteriales bacterium]
MSKYFTEDKNFFKGTNPQDLIEKYGSPLYVYSEDILRERCREMKNLVSYPKFLSNYSIKANSNLELLKITRSEGLVADAMSPGEIYVLEKAGFEYKEMFYISNNVSEEEMQFAIDRGIMVSIDSLSQLEMYGKLNPGSKVAIRFNPGVGAGHSEKVITGGKKTKFGVNIDLVPEVKEILDRYNLTLAGINQHIGSLFMEADSYIEGVKSVLAVAEEFENIEFVDFGGGFGIPYRKQEGEARLDVKEFGRKLDVVINEWVAKTGKELLFKIEPGRYIAAECGVILGTVHSIKNNYDRKYVGTDVGFNVLARPMTYGSHHDMEIYRNGKIVNEGPEENVHVVGNICESGDILAEDRCLPVIKEKDLICITDAGAYGYSMASNYNNRLRPAEVLITSDGSVKLIRKRDTLDDLVKGFLI